MFLYGHDVSQTLIVFKMEAVVCDVAGAIKPMQCLKRSSEGFLTVADIFGT